MIPSFRPFQLRRIIMRLSRFVPMDIFMAFFFVVIFSLRAMARNMMGLSHVMRAKMSSERERSNHRISATYSYEGTHRRGKQIYIDLQGDS